jgi:hypothetical protein
MTSEPDDYEALADRLAHTAGRGANGAVTRAFAVALRDHVEAKLAEVRAERDRWQQVAVLEGEERKAVIATSRRTIAEQAAVIERLQFELRNLLSRVERRVDQRDWVLSGDDEKAVYHARTALQEIADGK